MSSTDEEGIKESPQRKDSIRRKRVALDTDSDSDSSSAESSSSGDDADTPPRKTRKLSSDVASPSTSRTKSIGPSLPPGIKIRRHSSSSDSETDDSVYRQRHGCEEKRQGTESDSSRAHRDRSGTCARHGNSGFIGPVVPLELRSQYEDKEEEEEDDIIGPLPVASGGPNTGGVAHEFEQRARKMKDKLDGKLPDTSEVTERESWMMELPSLGRKMGLNVTARKLTSGILINEDDRREWTETPAERDKRLQQGDEKHGRKRKTEEECVASQRDQQLAAQVEEYNKKRSESLLDMHTKKLKKKHKKKEKKEKKKKSKDKKEKKKKKKQKEKEKKAAKKPERRPFDRDLDLQVNRFDDAQRKMLIKKSQGLNSNFSHGASQFL